MLERNVPVTTGLQVTAPVKPAAVPAADVVETVAGHKPALGAFTPSMT